MLATSRIFIFVTLLAAVVIISVVVHETRLVQGCQEALLSGIGKPRQNSDYNSKSWNFPQAQNADDGAMSDDDAHWEKLEEKYLAHAYEDRVHLRVIVMTYKRPKSLRGLLESLETVDMNGDKLSVEVWVDRDAKHNEAHIETIEVVKTFLKTTKINCNLHVHENHVGLYGQWLLTYRPSGHDEKVLFLEDDQEVSKFAYRWLKAVSDHYESDEDYLGCTLKSFAIHPLHESLPQNHSVFQHRLFSTHAFAPKLSVWREFQRWAARHYERKRFKPYVPNIVPTEWYKTFERTNKTASMWSIWMIYFTYAEQLFTVYPNVLTMPHFKATSKMKYCLNYDSQATGLHYSKPSSSTNRTCVLLDTWKDEFVTFPRDVYKIDWNGKKLK